MSSFPKRRRLVKPAVCESRVIQPPIAPCEILPRGDAGVVVINETHYAVEVLGYLPEVGEPVIDGYRLTKDNGVAHDICLVAGRLECTCGDWIWRRAYQTDRRLTDCKHTLACRKHFVAPVESVPVAVVAGRNECCFLCDRAYAECTCTI